MRRLDELDSLRGLAALSVVLYHFKIFWLDDVMRNSPVHQKHVIDRLLLPITAGHEAVILFFILSGFVLSLPAINLRARPYAVFILRRIFRIYIPYVAALFLAVLGNRFFAEDVTQSKCLSGYWSLPIDWGLFRQHLLCLGAYNTETFDPPIWTLVLEMRICLVFPFLCAQRLRLRPTLSGVLSNPNLFSP